MIKFTVGMSSPVNSLRELRKGNMVLLSHLLSHKLQLQKTSVDPQSEDI